MCSVVRQEVSQRLHYLTARPKVSLVAIRVCIIDLTLGHTILIRYARVVMANPNLIFKPT